MFGTKWKLPREIDKDHYYVDTNQMEDESEFDADTLPTRKNMRKMLKKIETYSLKQVGERVLDAKSRGALLINATDSTTRQIVGTFVPARIHINRNEYLPLATLPITSEIRNNTADSIATDFRLLEAASGISAEEIYSKIDFHMTSSTFHNKGITKNLAETFDRKEIAGQIHIFFYKHNAYKHIQPLISEKNKHMLSILSSLENGCSFLFSCLKSHSEAYSEPCQTSKIKLLPKIVNGF